MALNAAIGVAGFLLVAIALRDVFESVVVPRAVDRRLRLSALITRSLWRIWPSLGFRFYRNDEQRRDDFLGAFAPFSMVCSLVAWVAVLTIGYGLIIFALRAQTRPHVGSLGDAVYFAGTSLLTIGYGDFVSIGGPARFVSLAAGASGLAVVAVVTSYLFAVFGAFQRRERFVVSIGARAGSPSSGVGLLAIAAYAELVPDLDRLFTEAQNWAAEVMESHLAYPVLAFFRSSHDYESWIGTLGTLLDAAVLLLTVVDNVPRGQARIMYNVGRHATHDLAHYFNLMTSENHVGVEREEFDRACDRLAGSGYALGDRDNGWRRFSELRATYATPLTEMARWFAIPALQWVGDRSLISVAHVKEQMPPKLPL